MLAFFVITVGQRKGPHINHGAGDVLVKYNNSTPTYCKWLSVLVMAPLVAFFIVINNFSIILFAVKNSMTSNN